MMMIATLGDKQGAVCQLLLTRMRMRMMRSEMMTGNKISVEFISRAEV